MGLLLPPSSDAHPGYVSGRFYGNLDATAFGSGTQAADTLYLVPFRVFRPVTVAGLAARCETGAAATSLITAIYANDPAAGRPGAKLAELAAALSGVTGPATVNGSLAANLSLAAGVYWIGCIVNGATQFRAIGATSGILSGIVGSSTASGAVSSTKVIGLSKSSAYASGMPASLAGSSWTDVASTLIPDIGIQIA